MKSGKDAKTCEGSAFAQANGVVLAADELAPADPLAVDFAAGEPLAADDDEVVRSGLIFRAGDYPDKKFSMTADELAAAAAAFTGPVPVDLEHTPTVLDGKLGRVCALEADGEALFATVALPRWLDDAIGEAERKVSATWDRASKTLLGLALVLNPRVEDAALMSAYAAFAAARHDTPHGRMALQDLHDAASRGGAVCSPPSARMASRHEATAIQAIHDTAVEHGAACAALAAGSKPGYPLFGQPPTAAAPAKEKKRMGRFEQFLAWLTQDESTEQPPTPAVQLSGQTPPAGTPPAVTSPPAAVTSPPAATTDARDEQLAQMRGELERRDQENRRLKASFIAQAAAEFAASVIREGRALPAEQAAITAAYIQAATDDDALGPVTFADGTPGSRVELLKRTYAVRNPHQLDVERLPAQLTALINRVETRAAGGEVSEERRRELLGYSPVGRSVLAEQRQNGRGN